MESDLAGKIIKVSGAKYRVKKKIGKGTYSTIYEAYSDKHGTSVAIKHLSFKTSQKAAYESYVKEVAILENIESHQNIVKLLDKKEAVSDTEMEVLLILEYCIQSLEKIIESRKLKEEQGLPEAFILKIMFDISKAITHMHKFDPPIIHRDIRAGNILLGNDGNYKICNFGGCTKKVYENISEDDIGRICSDITNNTNPNHRAPEQLDLYSGFPINEKVDVWALAVVLYNLMYFKMPFSSSDKTNQIEGLVSYPQTDKYSMHLQRLLKKMFTVDPSKRPSMGQVFRYIENLQSKTLATNKTRPKSRDKFSMADERKDDSSDDDTRKYKTAHDTETYDDVQYTKAHIGDPGEKNFTGFATKVTASLSKNGTKGWVIYATENSSFPPRIQYISKLVLKAWRKRDKVSKFYKNISSRGFEQNTIVALK